MDDTRLLVHRPGDVVLHLVGAARNGKLIVPNRAATEDEVLPIGGIAQITGIIVVGTPRLVDVLGVIFGPEYRLPAHLLLGGKRTVEGNLWLTDSPVFGRNHHHAVSTPRAVDRRGRGVFQHFDGGDVFRWWHHATDDSIHDEQRVAAGVDGRSAPHPDFKARSRFAVDGLNLYARSAALQRLHGVLGRIGRQLLLAHAGHRSRQVAFLLGAVAHHHHFFQKLVVYLQNYTQFRAVSHLHFPGTVTHVRKDQHVASFLYFQGKSPLLVSGRTPSRAFEDYAHAG